MDIRLLPGNVIYKIANENFNAIETWRLARSCKVLFYGATPGTPGLSLLAKRKRLNELSHIVLTTKGDSCFLWVDGRLYVWGNNDCGQLGFDDRLKRRIPVEFKLTRLGCSATDKIRQFIVGGWEMITSLFIPRRGVVLFGIELVVDLA